MGTPTSDKSRAVAFILALLFGVLGFHRMYLGKVVSGVVMLILTLTFIGLWITAFWALIDIVMILVGKMEDSKRELVLTW